MWRIIKGQGWIVAIILIVLTSTAFFIYRIVLPSPNLPAFEVINFAGKVEVNQAGQMEWKPVNRGMIIGARDKLRTLGQSDADLKISDIAVFRLQEDSILKGNCGGLLMKTDQTGFTLDKGVLLGFIRRAYPEPEFKVVTPFLMANFKPDSLFMISANSKDHPGSCWVGLLRGEGKAQSKLILKNETYAMHPLDKAEAQSGQPVLPPVRVTRGEWDQMKESYELMERVAAINQAQMDLAKQAGSLFKYVFDHGTFYTPKSGYATREFIKDKDSGLVSLIMEYDVFPVGTYVGIYLKTRGLDVSQFERLEFETKIDEYAGFPKTVRIEFKDKYRIVKTYTIENFKPVWGKTSLPMNFKDKTPVSEITFVFLNSSVGEFKKGVLQVKDVNLIARTAGTMPMSDVEPGTKSILSSMKASNPVAVQKNQSRPTYVPAVKSNQYQPLNTSTQIPESGPNTEE